jgi:predicted transcriptional regulator
MDELAPSGREMEILKVLWEIGPASVRDVCRQMCPNQELAFNTIQTLLRIMDQKGLVSHKLQGRTFIYSPQYSRERATSSFLDKVFDGAIDQVVLSLLHSANPDAQELRQLEKIIADARRRKSRETY